MTKAHRQPQGDRGLAESRYAGPIVVAIACALVACRTMACQQVLGSPIIPNATYSPLLDTRGVTESRVRVTATTVLPFAGVAAVLASGRHGTLSCSGAVVAAASGRLTLLTAASCLYYKKIGNSAFVDSVVATPARNGASAPFGALRGTVLYIPRAYTTALKNGNMLVASRHDYALVSLSATSRRPATFQLWSQSRRQTTIVTTAGYPIDTGGSLMWKHQCRTVLDPARPTFSAPCNITAGETGAPLWIVETGPRTSSGIRLVGVWTSFANGTSESQARIANGDVASFLGAADRLGPSPCGSHCSRDAVCTSDGQSATCICKAGFAGNGLVCKRKPNPCLVNNGGCRPEATCTNSFGEAQCQCKPGYFARAGICVRTNPCLVEHGGCSFNATCDNVSPGTARCSCKPGFAGNGRACAFVDACQYEQYNGRPCAPNATCANLGMDAVCTCKPGFVGDGKTKCFPDPCIDGGGCSANATCSWNSTTGVARCACNPDWVGDGQTCFEDLCTPDRINATCGIPEFYSSCSTDPATGAPSCVCVQPGQENPYSLPKCRCSYGTEPKRDPITGNINCETVYVCCQIFRPPAPSLSCRSMVSCLHPAPDLGCCSGG